MYIYILCLLHFSISFSFALHFPSVEMRSIDRTIGGETSSRGRHFALSFVMYFFIIHLLQPYRAALRLPGRSIDILPTAAAEPAELVVEHGVSMDHRTMTEREIFVMPQRWSCYMVDENWLRLRASDGMGPCGRRWVSRSHIYPCRLVDIHILFSLLLIFYFQ